MRVLLVSDFAHTGFGRVGRELASGLIAKGHDLRIIAINWRGDIGELEGLVRKGYSLTDAAADVEANPFREITVPAGQHGDGMGNNLTHPAIHGRLWPGWLPEAAIVVADPRALWSRLVQDGGALGRIPTFNYVPIEGTNLPTANAMIWQAITPVAMSDFGKVQLETLLGREVAVAYHGVSPAFRPLAHNDPGSWQGKRVLTKDGAKEALGLAGRTIIFRADRYILRKNYPAFFAGLRPVLAAHPELTVVIHSPLADDLGFGDLRELLSREPGASQTGPNYFDWTHPQVIFTNSHDTFRGLADEDLRVLYCAADLYVSSSMAEGFGLCLAESLACGVPVVATDYSAIPEVVGPGGVLVPVSRPYTNPYSHEWALVDEEALSAAVERLVSKPALRRELGSLGRAHVARFTWPAAVDVFDALLTSSAAVAA